MKHLKLFFALFAMLALGVGNAWGAEYELVTSEPSDWSGEYLVVYNKGCFNGSLTTGFDKSAPVTVTISNNKINLDEKYAMIIGKQGTAYSLKTASGYYIGRESSSSNGMDANQTWSTKYTINFTWDATKKTVKIAGTGGKCLGLNSTTWRFYAASNTYVNLSLYKKVESGSTEPVPSLTATPIAVDFGNVVLGSDVESKTVSVNFENLTGNVTYSGLSNPFSATGNISTTGDKITISADASTIGEYSQTLTVVSTADSKTAEVTVKMNVVAPFEGKKLVFDFVTHPSGWPAAKANATAGSYVYTLDEVDYTFSHTKSGDGIYLGGTSKTSGYLMLASGNKLGLPAIKGYKLVKVDGTLNGSGTPSTASQVSITNADGTVISGGAAQTWDTKGGTKTYNLTDTEANTVYYLTVANKNLQMITLALYYEEVAGAADIPDAPTLTASQIFETETFTVEISAVDGATIHYTLDGSDPTEVSTTYSVPFTVNATTTVKAIAVKDGVASNVATATYTKVSVIEKTCAEAAAFCTSDESTDKYRVEGYVTAIETAYSAQYNNITVWMADTRNGGNVLQAFRATPTVDADKAVKVGDKIEVVGKLKLYNSTPEIVSGTYTITQLDPVYNVNITSEHGTATATPASAVEGTEITLSVEVESGWVFQNWTVTDASDTPIEVTENKFTMPASNVTVVANYTESVAADAVLKLSANDVVTSNTYKVGETVKLPETIENTCVKEFVGWSADASCATAPEYAPGADFTLTAEEHTLYAVYGTQTGGGEGVLTKMTSTDAFANGDKVVIVAYGTQLGMYQETSGTTYVKYWELVDNEPTVAELDDKTIWDVEADGENWKIGDATTGYLYNASSNNLAVSTTNASIWTITWRENGFVFKSNLGRYMACRTDLTTSNQNLYRMNGTTIGNNGVYEMDVYKYTSSAPIYSDYSTTCAAAAVATVNSTSVTATAAGAEGTVTVTYENVNLANVAVALFNDAACTDEFTAGWLTAAIDADKNITYTVAENTTYAERKAYIQLTAPETTGAVDPAVVVIPVTQAAKEKVFASLAELLANITPTADATKVTVTLTKEPIVDIYVSGNYRNGIFLNVPYQGTTKEIEIYSRDVPAEWVAGGSVSGTLTNCDWKVYNGTWELCPADWSELTYQEPKAVSTVVVSGAPTKTTYVDGEAFDPAGLTVTVNYNDATSEVNPTGVTFTVTPTTLVKGQTSVSVTATFNSVTSAAYEVTGLTVNDIPTKTIAEFIAACGTRCYLEGIVSGLTEGNSMKYGNFDLTDASGTIYVYGCLNASGEKEKFADLGVKNGDKIKVIADEYELYGGTKDEAKNVQYVSHVSAASITISDITMEVDEVATITATVEPAEAEVTYTIKENAVSAISLNGNTITALAEGTATITATVAEGATYLGNSVDFTVTVGPKTESDEVVILAEHNGQWYALKAEDLNSDKKVLAALAVTYFNGTLYNVNESDKISITWTRTVVGDQVTFKNGTNYLYVANPSKTELSLNATAFSWTYDAVLDTYTSNNGARTFLYSSEANGFKNFAINNNVGTKNYSGYPVVTAPVYTTGDVTYTRTTTPKKFGTICLPFGSANYSGATFYEFVGSETGKVILASVTTLEAGVPYIFLATGTELAVYSDGTTAATPGSKNGLVGTFTNDTEVAIGNYILKDNAICEVAATCWVNAYRAYIVMEDVPTGAPVQMPGRRYIGLDVHGENGTTGLDNIMTTDAPAKVIINGQLIIIRGGEMYNVQGQKL